MPIYSLNVALCVEADSEEEAIELVQLCATGQVYYFDADVMDVYDSWDAMNGENELEGKAESR